MLHRICGRAKSGKTERIMSIIGELIEKKQHTFLIVPEQQAIIAERQIISRFGNKSNMYVEVINFKRLCNRVFRETGGLSQSYIDTSEKLLIMSEAIESVKPHLTEYSAAAENTDFAEKALSAVNEFKQFGISPDVLENAAEKSVSKDELAHKGKKSHLTGKLADLSLIYASFGAILSEGFDDSGDDLDRLCDTIEKTDFFKDDVVLFDSFYGLTVQEFRIVCKIISSARDTYITFLLDKSENAELFCRSLKIFGKIEEHARLSGEDVIDEYLDTSCGYASPALGFLERGFSSDAAAKVTDAFEGECNGISEILCTTPFDEADAACALIRELIMEKGAKFGEIAICARNIESYTGIIDTALEKNEIPFNFNVRRELLTRPVIAYILSAFDIMKSGWQTQSVIRHIKTGLCCLTDEEADLFESYVKTWSLTGRRFLEDEWQMNPDGYSEELTKRGEYILEKVNVARQKLVTPLMNFVDSVKNASTCDEITHAVFDLLLESKTTQDGNLFAKDGENAVFWNLTMDALDCLNKVIGKKPVSGARYAELFRLIMSSYDTGRIPESVDEVTVSSAEGLRGIGIKYIIILGVNDGYFPGKPAEDSIFSDRDKAVLKELGIELSDASSELINDEMFLAYKVLTCASHGAFLLSSEKAANGDKIYPSIISAIVHKLFPTLVTEKFPFDGKRKFMFSKAKLFDLAFSKDDAVSHAALCNYFSSDDDYSERFSRLSQATDGGDSLSGETASALYGGSMTVSPSRLESFGNCEFSYFGTYILRLRPERIAGLGPLESGNIAHRILELLVARLAEEKRSTGTVDRVNAVNSARTLLADYIELLCGTKGTKTTTKRFDFLYKRLSGTVCELTAKIADEMAQSKFTPTEFELPIGLSGDGISSVEIPLPDGGTLRVNGKIDRTDVYTDGGKTYIRIADYKTGHKRFSLSDVALGTNLQMLLYLYSIIGNGKERFGENLIPAGVLYIPVRRPEATGELGNSDTENDASGEISTERPNGILIDDKEILCAMEKELSGKYIPVKLKKDGEFYANSSVITLADMGKLLRNAANVSAKLAAEIKSGSIRKNPVKCKEKNSCAFCDLAPLCRFDFASCRHTRFANTRYLDESDEISYSCAKQNQG